MFLSIFLLQACSLFIIFLLRKDNVIIDSISDSLIIIFLHTKFDGLHSDGLLVGGVFVWAVQVLIRVVDARFKIVHLSLVDASVVNFVELLAGATFEVNILNFFLGCWSTDSCGSFDGRHTVLFLFLYWWGTLLDVFNGLLSCAALFAEDKINAESNYSHNNKSNYHYDPCVVAARLSGRGYVP